MSLATRCPACGTVFRVVSDQLKVSEGWVRCGRCSEVFNAAQRLFELEQDTKGAAPPAQRPAAEVHRLPVRAPAGVSPAAARVSAALAPPSAPAEPELPQTAADQAPPPAAAVAAPPEDTPSTTTVVEAPVALAAPAPAPSSGNEGGIELQAEAPAEPADAAATATAAAVADSEAEPAGTMPTPEFVRRAERAARWRHPARRGPLAAAALLLVALLAGQIALHYRDRVAASWPDTRPWLQAACSLLACSIEAPRRIDSLNVDSSGLVRMQDSPLYRLSLVLQNKAPTAVRMPAIDLALTDFQGQTTARRVLTVAELGHPADSLPAGGEVALQATLDLGDRRVAGYTIELFYP